MAVPFSIALIVVCLGLVCWGLPHGQTATAGLVARPELSAILLLALSCGGIIAWKQLSLQTTRADTEFGFPLELAVALATPAVTIFVSVAWLVHFTRQHLQSLK